MVPIVIPDAREVATVSEPSVLRLSPVRLLFALVLAGIGVAFVALSGSRSLFLVALAVLAVFGVVVEAYNYVAGTSYLRIE